MPNRESPPLFRHTGPSERKCGMCRAPMVRLLGLAADWFACTRCDGA